MSYRFYILVVCMVMAISQTIGQDLSNTESDIQALENIQQYVTDNEELLQRYVANTPWENGRELLDWLAVIKQRKITPADLSRDMPVQSPCVPPIKLSNALGILFCRLAEANRRYSGKKLSSSELFAAVMRLARSADAELRNFAHDGLGGLEGAFVDGLWLTEAGFFMAPYLRGEYDSGQLLSIGVPAAVAQRFQDYFRKEIADNWKRIHGQTTLEKTVRLLQFNAYFGEPQAEKELISMFHRQKGFDDGYELFLGTLLELHTPATLTAILSRFREETGAPDFTASRDRASSPRHMILSSLMRIYPDDGFFVKYRNYLSNPENLDSMIGGESGVKQLFADLQKWTKERFGYNLDLTGASYHINLKLQETEVEFWDVTE